jgi:purine-nucleoside phosphorylase
MCRITGRGKNRKVLHVVLVMIHQRAAQAADRFVNRFHERPDVAVITGSGHRPQADIIDTNNVNVDSALISDITDLPDPSVAGHGSMMSMREIDGKKTLFVSGRHHLYEGCSVDDVCLVTTMCAHLGTRHIIYVNAVGGLDPVLQVGDVVLVQDLMIVPMVSSPLPQVQGSRIDSVGSERELSRYHEGRSGEWRDRIAQRCRDGGVAVREGTYLMVPGPSYETRAEVRMARRLGADIIGMSTAYEAIHAARSGMKVAVLSLVTNRLTDVRASVLSHHDVVEAAGVSSATVTALINSAILCA